MFCPRVTRSADWVVQPRFYLKPDQLLESGSLLMSSVEIIVGHRWREDVRFLSELRAYRPLDTTVNLTEIRDIIDIVIDGKNITSGIAEESIFGVFGELLAALHQLVNGESQKAIVEFQCEPWELVLVPRAKQLLVSVYSVDRHHRVVADNIAISARAFVDAVTDAAETMLADLFRISERFSNDGLVRRFSSQLTQIRRHHQELFASVPESRARVVCDRGASTSNSSGVTLSYEFDGSGQYLREYCGEHAFDLHALLFSGRVQAEVNGQNVTLAENYPYLCMAALLGRARELLNYRETRQDVFDCVEAMPYGYFDVHGRGNVWNVHIESEAMGENALNYDVQPDECIDSLVTLGELFVRDLLDLNPHLELNQRFVDLSEEVRSLRSWQQDLMGKNQYLETPEEYLRNLGHLEPTATPVVEAAYFPWPLDQVRALFPHRSWQYEAAQIAFGESVALGDVLMIAGREGLVCVDRADGRSRWKYEWSEKPEQTVRFSMAGELALVAENNVGLRLLELGEGQEVARNDELKRWGGLLGAAQFADERLVVLADLSGRVAGISSVDGGLLWEHSVGIGRYCGFGVSGPLVSVLSTEGSITTLNPLNGNVLWKVRAGGLSDVPLQYHQGRLYGFAHDINHRAVTVQALFPFTGRTVWQLRVPGMVVGIPSFIDRWMILPMERAGKIVLVGVDIEVALPQVGWQIELSSAGLYEPTQVESVEIDGHLCGLVKTDRGELTCFRLRDGQVCWRVMPAAEIQLLYRNLPIVVIESSVLVAEEQLVIRSLEDGRPTHRFYGVDSAEFISVAGGLSIVIGEQGNHHDGLDRVTGLDLGYFLGVVRGVVRRS